MIITNCLVEKIEKGHPRYPDDASVSFSEVYRCEVTFSDGSQKESAFFVTPFVGAMTAENAAKMFALFSRAISQMDDTAEAA